MLSISAISLLSRFYELHPSHANIYPSFRAAGLCNLLPFTRVNIFLLFREIKFKFSSTQRIRYFHQITQQESQFLLWRLHRSRIRNHIWESLCESLDALWHRQLSLLLSWFHKSKTNRLFFFFSYENFVLNNNMWLISNFIYYRWTINWSLKNTLVRNFVRNMSCTMLLTSTSNIWQQIKGANITMKWHLHISVFYLKWWRSQRSPLIWFTSVSSG